MGLEKWRCLLRCPRRRPHWGPRRRRPQGSGRRAPLILRRRSVCVPVLMEWSMRAAVRTRLTDTTPSALVTVTTDACTAKRYAEAPPVTHIFTHISGTAVWSVTWLQCWTKHDNANVLLQVLITRSFIHGWTLTPRVRVWLAVRSLDCRWTSHLLQKGD